MTVAVFTMSAYGPRLMFYDNIPQDIKTVFDTDPNVVLTKDYCYEIQGESKIVNVCEKFQQLGVTIVGDYHKHVFIIKGHWYIFKTLNIKMLAISDTELIGFHKDGSMYTTFESDRLLKCKDYKPIDGCDNNATIAAFDMFKSTYENDGCRKTDINTFMKQQPEMTKAKLVLKVRDVYDLDLMSAKTIVEQFLATR